MKVSLNLARAQGFRQRHLLAWSVPLLLISGFLMLRMILGAQANWKEYRGVRDAANKESDRQGDLLAREAALRRKLDEPDNRALLREVQFVNYLIDERQLSFGELTDKVTALLPAQARLAGLSMPDADGDPLVHFAIEGSGEEPVETFLTNLENSPDFKDLIITNQGFEEKESGGAPVSITCNARYVGGRGDMALVSAKAKAGEPAGEDVLKQPAPSVKAGEKASPALGVASGAKPAGAPLRAGSAPGGAQVIPPAEAPPVKGPQPLKQAPKAPMRAGTPSPRAPASAPARPRTN